MGWSRDAVGFGYGEEGRKGGEGRKAGRGVKGGTVDEGSRVKTWLGRVGVGWG